MSLTRSLSSGDKATAATTGLLPMSTTVQNNGGGEDVERASRCHIETGCVGKR